MELEEEGDAAGFLGVQLHHNESTGHIHMTQEGLIKWIIAALGLDMDQTNAKGTPAECKPLVKDEMASPSRMPSTTQVWLECSCICQDTQGLT